MRDFARRRETDNGSSADLEEKGSADLSLSSLAPRFCRSDRPILLEVLDEECNRPGVDGDGPVRFNWWLETTNTLVGPSSSS